jgi:molecular chaperone DnaK
MSKTREDSVIIGIDLGTTNSCVAVMQGKDPRVLENNEGESTTASVVAFTAEGEQLVGITAKRQMVTNRENTIYASKRYIGHQFSDKVIKKLKPSFNVVKGSNGDAWFEIEINGKKEKWSPEQVGAAILRNMKEVAEKHLGHAVKNAVITVPAYFNDAQRQATKDAGRIAGLEVKRIINEPTAAALAYGMSKKRGDRKIAVYDLGGGTFDISVIEIADVDGDHQFEVLATSGDSSLGGEDFDNHIIEYLAEEFKKDTGIDLSKDSMALQRLKEAAEKAKIELSTTQQTDINLPFITADQSGPKHLNLKLTRAKLEALVEDLLNRTLEPCRTAMKDAGLKNSEISEVILVGGQTRMPKVQGLVKEFFGKEPRHDVNPDQAVAIGASIQAAVLSGDVKDILLLDVTPLSLGIETMGSIMTKLIEKNTTIPTKASQVFSTAADNQSSVTVHVLQGEREVASANKSLGRFDLADIPPAPRGTPQIEVAFDIDANGIMNVSAKDKVTNRSQSIVIKSAGGLSEEEIEALVKDAEENAEADKAFTEMAQTQNQADALIHSTKKALSELGKDVEDSERKSIEDAIAELEKAMKGKDKADIDKKSETLSQVAGKMTERLYAKKGAEQQAQEKNAAKDDASKQDKPKKPEGKTVDAEFEEVSDEDKKK